MQYFSWLGHSSDCNKGLDFVVSVLPQTNLFTISTGVHFINMANFNQGCILESSMFNPSMDK